MTVDLRHLRIAAHGELVSLVLMLANLATVHARAASSLLGPAHGCAYLVVVVATWRLARAAPVARVLALVPGIGGLLAVRSLRRAGPGEQRTAGTAPG
ncbi:MULTISPECIES: DUF3817 domain-containing protein [Streptomyces]|uniref:DUF3817 domain-containing protein n=1 Tax=Streptomyces TaxID=1883 RepID=UPI001F2EB1B3|nr:MULTISPECIES: DUF3817 domain-containing protein [Streptomyces]